MLFLHVARAASMQRLPSPSRVLNRKIVSRCRERATRVYYGAVFEIKKEIPVRVFGRATRPHKNIVMTVEFSSRAVSHASGPGARRIKGAEER